MRDPFRQLLAQIFDYCHRVLPGDVPAEVRITFASGRRIIHPVPLVGSDGSPRSPRGPRSASVDFRSVYWYGDSYTFTATQAACVRVLWEALENGTEEIGQALVLTEAGSECDRLSALFTGHPAWGAMIVPGKSRGSFRLQPPAVS